MNYMCNFLKVRKCYFVESFFQIEPVAHQSPQRPAGLALGWVGASMGGGLPGGLRPFQIPAPSSCCPSSGHFPGTEHLPQVFSVNGPLVGQQGRQVIWSTQSSLWTGIIHVWDKIWWEEQTETVRREVWEGRWKRARRALGPEGEVPGWLASLQLCYAVWCLPETEDAVGRKQEDVGWVGPALGGTLRHPLQMGIWKEEG